jgi:iron complex outermembrane receptor protein
LRTNTDLSQGDAFVAAGWDAPTGASLMALLSGYSAERGVAPELHVASPRRWRYPDHARTLVQLQATAPRFAGRFGTTAVSASIGALDARVRIEQFSDLTFTTVSGTEAGDERVASGRVAVTQVTPRGHEWRGALTVNDVWYDETLNADPTSHYRQRLVSAGLEREWSAGASNLLTAGVVLDQASTLESGGKAATPDRGIVGWRVGATHTLSASTRTHASVSSRPRFPALRELYSGALNRFEPNPALRPEQLLAAEAGATWGRAAAGGPVRAQIVAFHHWLDDAVVRVPFDTTTRFIRINRDQLRSLGVETSFGWRGASDASVDFDLLVQRVRIRDASADAAARRPEHMPGVRAMLSGARGVGRGVVLGASIAHIGSQYCVNPGGSGNLTLGAQSVAGVTAERSWTLSGAFTRLRMLLGADNLADATVYEQCGIPRAGRTLRVGFSLS